MDKIPVTLLTGFLGAGKTTLLRRLLADPRFADTAVVINEFGEVGLDHVLVEAAPEAIVEMTSGCLCCTVRGDIRQTLLMLLARSEAGEIPLFSRLVVETTGLADPAPVIHTLMVDPRLARRFRLAQVVTVVDAVNGRATLAAHPEAVKQAAVADRLVLTKTDLAETAPAAGGAMPGRDADLAGLRRALHALNPGAALDDANAADFDLRRLVTDAGGFDPAARGPAVRDWLAAEAVAAAEAAPHGHHDHHDGDGHGDHDHAHDTHHHAGHAHGAGDDAHPHDVNRHSEAIRAYCLTLEAPISRFAFAMAMELLAANQGEDLLRVKGIVALAEQPERPLVIHGVQHLLHEPVTLERWPDDDRRTRLVFITRNIPRETMQRFFDAWTAVSATDL